MTELRSVEVFASHEGLLLEYEQAATRRVPRRQGWWNLATHLPWIGDRTRQIGGAHVEYFRGIENPVGLKVGPTMEPEELVALCQILNPQAEPGRLVLIHRFGAHAIAEKLPPLIQAVRATGCPVVWTSDPMHGNTRTTGEGIKTRSFDDVLGELNTAQDIHTAHGTVLAGVHFELTGENVTECTGGARGLSEMDLHRKYESDVDPRLNYEQALEMALSIARRIRAARNGEG